MSEWFKEHAWKVCIGLKLIAGSNPALSAEKSNRVVAFFVFTNQPPLHHLSIALPTQQRLPFQGLYQG